MKNPLLFSATIIMLLCTTLSGCEIIGGIFKAGVWSGVLLVVLGIAAIIFIVTRLFKKE